MSEREKQSKKKLKGKDRIHDAKRWLKKNPRQDLISSYAKRYGISEFEAEDELMQIGYYDEIYIQRYEKKGIEWEYRVEPLSGDMIVVPKDAEEHEIYEIHGLF